MGSALPGDHPEPAHTMRIVANWATLIDGPFEVLRPKLARVRRRKWKICRRSLPLPNGRDGVRPLEPSLHAVGDAGILAIMQFNQNPSKAERGRRLGIEQHILETLH